MWQGNDGNAVQTLESPNVTAKRSEYADNRERILLAQSADAAVAERAMSELIEANGGLIRTIALRFRDRGVDLEDL